MMRILVFAAIILAGTAAVCGVFYGITNYGIASMETTSPTKDPTHVSPAVELYDVDAMAARMPKDKDYYAKVRDEALAYYAKKHPSSAPYDDEAKMSIKLAAYYMTWGDVYGERVLLDLADIEEDAEKKGLHDPTFCNLQTDGWDDNHIAAVDSGAVEDCDLMLAAAKDSSPNILKFWGYQTVIHSTFAFNDNGNTLRQNTPSMQKLPQLISLWGDSLRQLIADKAPDHVILDMPIKLMHECNADEGTLNLLISAIDRAYNEAGADTSGRVAMDGDYFTEMAWAARGAGYANTVSSSQFQTFDGRLQQARALLEQAYAKYPNEPRIPGFMLRVALGGSIDVATAETWYQRAIKADPTFYNGYVAREWYLQPRWCGSVDDEWKFVQECVATQDWANRLPMIIAPGLNNVADDGDSGIYSRDDVWQVVNTTYRKYLEMYPRAFMYRTYFLRAAYLGNHPDVMKEQYKILGPKWDDDILSDDEYKAISASVGP